ncbi:MAG: HAMP domain-containing histidine kinase [Planctomycetes bacterium]|nr:HAMP domain-containing histidine kinase [Planctomycetota bacterium]
MRERPPPPPTHAGFVASETTVPAREDERQGVRPSHSAPHRVAPGHDSQAAHATHDPDESTDTARSARARSLEHVAAGAAHDLSRFLGVVESNLDVLSDEWISTQGADTVRSLRAVTKYLRGVAGDLRTAAAGDLARPACHELRLTAWWRDMGMLLRAAHGDEVIIHADIPRGLPRVRIDHHHLTRVVYMLVRNASHAIAAGVYGDDNTPKRGEVAISARLAADGRVVSLAIADNRAAAPAPTREITGTPTRSAASRTGRGGEDLAIARRLMDDAGANVRLSSVTDSGTTVTIELPTFSKRPSLANGR